MRVDVGVERREDVLKKKTERRREESRRMRRKMTGSGAVIHLLTARATAENRSNPLV